MLKDILPFLELNGQFGKLTDHTGEEPRSLSLPKEPLLFNLPCLFLVLFSCISVLIRGKAYAFACSYFRV